TGTISSLQRQLEIQESQLRRCRSEKQMLQRELREREKELQALSAKFYSLGEEQEQAKMMVTMEKENRSLRQVVSELKSKRELQNELISELQGTVRRLQAEALSSQHQIRRQRREQEELQGRAETLQHRLLQTTVALESITSKATGLSTSLFFFLFYLKFERYRNKIIQATFRTAGTKPPQAELRDEEVLEALQ
ncbi:CCD27 protein, partial [Piaya cayana]|nr:CCD27 protein [Piaya cayana]